jgi:hypothetical protein
MIDFYETSADVLKDVGFSTAAASVEGRNALAFEDATVLGFILIYDSPRQLIANWSLHTNGIIQSYQLGLRRAGSKAWNTYVVLLAIDVPDYAETVALSAIEEDLAGTRKIARAGIADAADLRAALLPLLPLQRAPKLEAVDIVTEIRERTTELPPRAVEAFLSTAEETVVLQVLEEAS